MLITAIITAVAAYLIGSINFAVIFSNAFLKTDVRKLGSGNAGTTNVMRNAGFLPGALTLQHLWVNSCLIICLHLKEQSGQILCTAHISAVLPVW